MVSGFILLIFARGQPWWVATGPAGETSCGVNSCAKMGFQKITSNIIQLPQESNTCFEPMKINIKIQETTLFLFAVALFQHNHKQTPLYITHSFTYFRRYSTSVEGFPLVTAITGEMSNGVSGFLVPPLANP